MKARKRAPSGGARASRRAARPTPEALLELAAGRDRSAFLDLSARFAPVLLGLASQVSCNPIDAAAAVEETFVRLRRQASQFPRESASVAAWLLLEARRNAVQKRRQTLASVSRPEDAFPLHASSNSWLPRPEDVSKLESKRELLTKTLRQLPRPQQEALMMAVWEGLTEEAISEKTGEPLAKVQSSLRAGMRFIRHRMKVVLGTWSAHI